MTFRQKVLEIVRNTSRGKTLTYKEVARRAGNGKAARAVGAIMRKNFDLKIPCHRIVCSDKTIGNYNRGKDMKEKLLRNEGVGFKKAGVLLSAIFFLLSSSNAMAHTDTDHIFSEGELSDVIRPAVVRLTNTISGDAEIPSISYDIGLNRFSIVQEDTTDVSFDETIVGTGFFVSYDGTLVTSVDFVQGGSVLSILATKYIRSAFDLRPFDQNKELQQSLELRGIEFLKNKITIVNSDTKIVVANTQGKEKIVSEIFNNDDVINNIASIAILSVPASSVPVLEFAPISAHPKFYVFNFPSENPNDVISLSQSHFLDGQLNRSSFFVQGSLGVSSFGGPVFDEEGEVHGLIERVDNGSAHLIVSSTDIVRTLADNNVETKDGIYRENFVEGLSHLADRRCKASINSFEKASKVDTFIGVDTYIDTYTAQCQDLISTGGSLDTFGGAIRSFIDNSFPLFILLILSVIFLLFYMTKVVRQILSRKKVKNLTPTDIRVEEKSDSGENN